MCSCAASCGVINDNNNNNNKSRRSADAPQSSPRPGHQRNSFSVSTPVHSSAAGKCGLLPQHNERRIRSRRSRCFCLVFTPAALCWSANNNNNNNNKIKAKLPRSCTAKSSKPRGPGFPSLEFSCIKDTVERRCLSLPSVYSLALLCHRRRRQMCCRINGADVAVISTEGRRRCMALKVARRPAVQVGGGGGRESGSIATSARSRRRLTVAG